MQFNKVHLLFEQSGTFKKVFCEKGIEAYDYDEQNLFGETDIKVDLFLEITKSSHDDLSIFSKMTNEDLVIAFFPCTYFSDQSQLVSRGDGSAMKEWTLQEKIQHSITEMRIRADYYVKLCQLCLIALKCNFKLVIENPLGKCGFLKQYFPIKERVVIKDRTKLGDYFKKPTQFFFVNCKPAFNLEKESEWNEFQHKVVEQVHGFDRSRISSEFAKNFVELFLEEE